jgi:hypothetical protein
MSELTKATPSRWSELEEAAFNAAVEQMIADAAQEEWLASQASGAGKDNDEAGPERADSQRGKKDD